MYDAVVIGGGVAGCTFSSKLSEKGFKTLLIERKEKEKSGDKICGDGIGKDVISNLKTHFNIALSGNTIVHETEGAVVYSPMLKKVHFDSKWFLVSRPLFGKDLISSAEGNGAEILDNTLCTGLLLENNKVTGVRTKTKNYRARLVVDATGPFPLIKKCLPDNKYIPKTAGIFDSAVSYREIVSLKKPIEDKSHLHIYFNLEDIPMGYFWIFPKDNNTVNVGVGNLNTKNPVDIFKKYVKKLNLEIKSVKSAGGGIIPVRRPAPSFVLDNFMLIGDSASQCSPLHGGGIGNTIKASIVASDKAVSALENDGLSLKELWGYNSEYMHQHGYRSAREELTKLFVVGLGNEKLEFLFDAGLMNSIKQKGMAKLGFSSIVPMLIKQPVLGKSVFDYGKRAKAVEEHYQSYPETPDSFEKWLKKDNELFEQAKKVYGVK